MITYSFHEKSNLSWFLKHKAPWSATWHLPPHPYSLPADDWSWGVEHLAQGWPCAMTRSDTKASPKHKVTRWDGDILTLSRIWTKNIQRTYHCQQIRKRKISKQRLIKTPAHSHSTHRTKMNTVNSCCWETNNFTYSLECLFQHQTAFQVPNYSQILEV